MPENKTVVDAAVDQLEQDVAKCIHRVLANDELAPVDRLKTVVIGLTGVLCGALAATGFPISDAVRFLVTGVPAHDNTEDLKELFGPETVALFRNMMAQIRGAS